MLTVAQNERLTQVGPGTPMGELFRRYWLPVAATGKLEEEPTLELRILGEDLVLYKDRGGKLGLIDRLCAHRRVNLAYGIPEERGLRCMYHGWLYDETGQCIEQPFEETVRPESRFKDKIKLNGYPVQAFQGLIWAYMGPLPAPVLPGWEPMVRGNTVKDIAITELPCSWLQCMENSMDPVHVEWLHVELPRYLQEIRGNFPVLLQNTIRHQKIAFTPFEHGIIKRRVLEGKTEEDHDWKVGHPVLFPNILHSSSILAKTFQHRVPIDDEHTLHITYYVYQPFPGRDAPEQGDIPYRYIPSPREGRWPDLNLTLTQDMMAWVEQGPIAPRHLEHLAESDKGIIMFRQMLEEQMRIVEDGGDPINVFRDREAAECVTLPMEDDPFGQRPDSVPVFTPLEGGETPAMREIEQVLATWGPQP